MENNLLPPGFRDELYEKSSIEHKYKNIIIDIFQINGYELIKTPLIEYVNLENKNNSFTIKDKNEKNDLSLRNDITMQIGRVSSSRLGKKKRPLKLCYYGEVVRKKGTMLRPERQFLQVGAECIGEKNYLADVEMLNLAYQSLSSVGIKDISIELSSHVFLDYLMKNNKKNDSNKKMQSFLRKKDFKSVSKFLDSDLHEFAHNLLACSGKLEEKKNFLDKLKINQETTDTANDLLNIYESFTNRNNEAKIILDLSESNYLDYHTGIRFTIFAKNVRGEVARGGRYELKNNALIEHSTGFNCYMDTIVRASSYIEKIHKILIPFDTSEKIKNNLIKKGYVIETFFGDLKNIVKFAKEKKIKFYLFKDQINNL